MLRIIVGEETFNDETQEFGIDNPITVDLEHSLLSVSKWESKHQKPFLIPGDKSRNEIFDYLKAMIVTPTIGPDVLDRCSQENLNLIQEYINSSQSATTFGTLPERRGQGEIITSELIYYWMVAFTIPFECERWHLNRLFSLIRICNLKNSKPKRMSKSEIAQRNRELNDQRRAQLGTKG